MKVPFQTGRGVDLSVAPKNLPNSIENVETSLAALEVRHTELN